MKLSRAAAARPSQHFTQAAGPRRSLSVRKRSFPATSARPACHELFNPAGGPCAAAAAIPQRRAAFPAMKTDEGRRDVR
jgi:hypothetical protein